MSYARDWKEYRALLKALGDRFSKPIYHYTTAEGLKGIVDSHELWLANAPFVNDVTECRAFWDEPAEDLLVDEGLTNRYVKEKLRLCLEDRPENSNYYIASFSRMGDCLSQYRAYGSFCVGFEPRMMSRRHYNLYRCVYRETDVIDWVCKKARLLKWHVDCLKEDSKRCAAADLVFAASVKYKNVAFGDEREVRLVAVSYSSWELPDLVKAVFPVSAPTISKCIHADKPPIHFRHHPQYGSVPFVKFFLTSGGTEEDSRTHPGKETEAEMKERKREEENVMQRELLPITEVWIGPMERQKEAELACKILLQERGYDDVEVIPSKIPYRGS